MIQSTAQLGYPLSTTRFDNPQDHHVGTTLKSYSMSKCCVGDQDSNSDRHDESDIIKDKFVEYQQGPRRNSTTNNRCVVRSAESALLNHKPLRCEVQEQLKGFLELPPSEPLCTELAYERDVYVDRGRNKLWLRRFALPNRIDCNTSNYEWLANIATLFRSGHKNAYLAGDAAMQNGQYTLVTQAVHDSQSWMTLFDIGKVVTFYLEQRGFRVEYISGFKAGLYSDLRSKEVAPKEARLELEGNDPFLTMLKATNCTGMCRSQKVYRCKDIVFSRLVEKAIVRANGVVMTSASSQDASQEYSHL